MVRVIKYQYLETRFIYTVLSVERTCDSPTSYKFCEREDFMLIDYIVDYVLKRNVKRT